MFVAVEIQSGELLVYLKNKPKSLTVDLNMIIK